jgi:hypothetical protein
MCRENLPFKVNGNPYFEAVEFVNDMSLFHRENYIALCPNHAAMFRFANEDDRGMEVIIASGRDNKVSCKIAGVIRDIYFTKLHLADIKAVVDAFKKQ